MTPQKTRRKVAVQKSIFTRYLAITMGIVVLSFIMLGTVMMAFFSQYWKNEKRDLLTQNATSIAEMSNAFLSKTSEDTYQLQTTVLKTFIDAFSTSIDADIFITDLEGNILLGNYPNSKLSQPQSVPQQTVSLAAQGMYEGRNTFGGLYRSPSFIIGVPMYAGENKDMCVGAVFAATSVSTVSAFQGEALQMFLVAAAAALGITFIVVGAFAYRLVQPLRQMSAAARTFGGGDFSVRVPVTSADELGQLALSFNNMANSLIVGGLKCGMDVSVACPEGYDPDQQVLDFARTVTGCKFQLCRRPEEAAVDADVVITDVWASMGQEEEKVQREKAFAGYQVNAALMALAHPGAMVQHCLPAHREEEITAEVFEAHAGEIFDEAENRLHAQKAVMYLLMGEETL